MIVYGLKACDTCRKVLKSNPEARLRDVRDTPLSDAEWATLLDALGPDLVNRRSTTWRGLDADQRARPVTELLADYPALMKRPVIEEDGKLRIGV